MPVFYICDQEMASSSATAPEAASEGASDPARPWSPAHIYQEIVGYTRPKNDRGGSDRQTQTYRLGPDF